MSAETARLRGSTPAIRIGTPTEDAEPSTASVETTPRRRRRAGRAEALVGDRIETLAPLLSSLAEVQRPVNESLVEAMARVLRAGEEPVRAAFLARSLNALARLTPELDVDALGEAAGRESNYGVLLRALQEPAALAALKAEDPLAEAYLRGLETNEEILRAEGGTLTVEEAARHLGITRQAIDKRRRAGRLLALPIGRHRYAYPAWQFGSNGPLPGFEEVMAEFFQIDAWTRAAFFLGRNTYLDGRRPLDELRSGSVDAVRRAAWAHGQQGAP